MENEKRTFPGAGAAPLHATARARAWVSSFEVKYEKFPYYKMKERCRESKEWV